jgi:hypothetical protein
MPTSTCGRGGASFFFLDGDEEGKRKKARIESWKTKANRDCPVLTLGDLKSGNCSIEDFLEFSLLKESVVAACKEAIGLGVVQPKNTDWEARLRAQLDAKDGSKSLGKKIQEAEDDVFGDSIGDVWVARKYSEYLRKEANAAQLTAYWENKLLQDLTEKIWTALELPNRGDTADIPLATTV